MFSSLVGNTRIRRCLELMLQRGTVGNSLLFAGPDGVGKALFAEAFARLVVGTAPNPHPDIHHYRPEGKLGMHAIDSMRRLSEEVHLPPYQSKRKAFIIHDAERMLPYSANALLKTFEEPSLDSLIILVSGNKELLLETIISRCRTLDFHPLKEEEIALLLMQEKGLPEAAASQIAAISGGSAGHAFQLAVGGEHPLRPMLLELLAAGKFSSYADLIGKAKEIADIITLSSKNIEEDLRTKVSKSFREKLSAVQREALEKEIEGQMALYLAEESQFLFEITLSWYRDLHLLGLRGNDKYLLNPDWACQAKAWTGDLLSLESILETIKDVKTSLARSTSLTICLENLFLRLNLF